MLKEKTALEKIRAYAQNRASLEETLDTIMDYSRPLLCTDFQTSRAEENKLAQLYNHYRHTLEARPWRQCGCPICQQIGLEVIIFRSSNRNKRRGIHNLSVFYQQLQTTRSPK